MRHVTEGEIALSGEYQDIFDACVETLCSISPGPTYSNFTVEYANVRSGKMRAVSSQFDMSLYVFVAEVTITREEGCLVHILVGVDAISWWDFGWSRRVLKRFVERMTAFAQART